MAMIETTFKEMDERLKMLESRVSQNSQNSHRPPSSEGLRKPPPRSERKKTGRRSGGQAGHEGTRLEMAAEPDEIVDHWPRQCAGCGEILEAKHAIGYEARQIHDLPAIEIEVTEHRGMKVCCCGCGTVTRGAFPERVTQQVQYGSGIAALAVYANVYQLLPLERTSDLLEDLGKRRLSEGTLVNMLAACGKGVAPSVANIKAALSQMPVLHMDETGLRVMNKLHWLHVVATDQLTFYAVDEKRGKQAHEKIGILPEYNGVAVHDAYASYDQWTQADLKHGLCNAHLLRDLQAIHELTGQRWACDMKVLLSQMKAAVDHAKTLAQPELTSPQLTSFITQYDAIVRRALQSNSRPIKQPGKRGRAKASPPRNLAQRLRDRKHDILRFLHDFRVPFDNNQAERDLRMMKVKQKVSGCFRSLEGAHTFAAIRSYLSSARKQGFHALLALRAIFDGSPIILRLA
ncbi:MAG: IS66 family transposase [Anaerolineae bacterium]|nr:IS66 family transposase [Anaerolineae bacterium]